MTNVTRDGLVQFRFFRPDVQGVTVVGDFNGWRTDALPMHPAASGWWRAETQLQGGDYRFRYLADGVWYTDYAAYGIELHQKMHNSVLHVPECPQRLRNVA